MKRRYLSFFVNSIVYGFIGLYFDNVISLFGVKSNVAILIICFSLFLSIVPFIFAVDVYEHKIRRETKQEKGFWIWKSTEVSATLELSYFSVVKLFGIIPITEPVPIIQEYSSNLTLQTEIDDGNIRNFRDIILSLIPIINGWYAQPLNKR